MIRSFDRWCIGHCSVQRSGKPGRQTKSSERTSGRKEEKERRQRVFRPGLRAKSFREGPKKLIAFLHEVSYFSSIIKSQDLDRVSSLPPPLLQLSSSDMFSLDRKLLPDEETQKNKKKSQEGSGLVSNAGVTGIFLSTE